MIFCLMLSLSDQKWNHSYLIDWREETADNDIYYEHWTVNDMHMMQEVRKSSR